MMITSKTNSKAMRKVSMSSSEIRSDAVALHELNEAMMYMLFCFFVDAPSHALL